MFDTCLFIGSKTFENSYKQIWACDYMVLQCPATDTQLNKNKNETNERIHHEQDHGFSDGFFCIDI